MRMRLRPTTDCRFAEPQTKAVICRLNLAIAFAMATMLTGGCASEFKPLQFPDPVVLKEPKEEMAVVYIMRTAHDSPTVDVFLNGVRTAQLPKESYAILQLKAGTYTFSTNENIDPNEATPLKLSLPAGERRFVYTSTASSRRTWLPFVGVVGAMAPLFMEQNSADGARKFTECTEADAQGFFPILKRVSAERNDA